MKIARSVARLAAQASARPGGYDLEALEANPEEGIYILLAQLDRAKEACQEATRQREQVEEALARQEQAQAANTLAAERLGRRAEELEKEVRHLTAQLESEQRRQEEQRASEQERLAELSRQGEQLAETLAGERARFADELEAERSGLREAIEREREELAADFERERSELAEQLGADRAALESELARERERITLFSASAETLAEQLTEVGRRMPPVDAVEQLDRLARHNEELTAALAECQALIARLPEMSAGDPSDNGAQRLLQSKLADLATTRTELATREAELEQVRQELDKSQRRSDQMRRKLDESQRATDRLQERVDRLLAGQHQTSSGAIADPAALATLRDKLAEVSRERDALRSAVAANPPGATSDELERLRAELAEVQSRAEELDRTNRVITDAEHHRQQELIARFERQTSQLDRELQAARARVIELEHTQSDARLDVDRQTRRLAELEAERQTMTAQIARLNAQLTDSNEREARLSDELRTERSRRLDIEGSATELAGRLERDHLAHDGLRSEVEHLKLRNETLASDRDGLKAELEMTASRLERAQADRAKLMEELGQERLRIDQQSSERRQLERLVNQYSSQIQQLETQTSEVTGLLAHVQHHLGAGQREGATLSELAGELAGVVEGRMRILQETLDAEQGDRSRLEQEADRLQGQVVELESALREVGGERERLERRMEEREEEFEARAQQMVDSHQQELAKLTGDFDQLSKRYQEVCEGFRNFHDTRRHEQEKLKLDLAEKCQELEEAGRQLQEMENQLVTADVIRGEKLRQREEQVVELRALLEEARVELGQRRTEHEALQREKKDALEQADQIRRELGDRLAEVEAARDRATDEVKSLRNELSEIEARRTDETATLRKEVSVRENRVTQLTTELATARGRINEIESRVRSKMDEAARKQRQLEQTVAQYEHDLQVLETAFSQRGARIGQLEEELDEVVMENEQLQAVSTAPALVNGQHLATQIQEIQQALGDFVQRQQDDRSQIEQTLGVIGTKVERLAEREPDETPVARRRRLTGGRTFSAVTPPEEMRREARGERESKQEAAPRAAEENSDLEATLERLRTLRSESKKS